MRKKDLDLLLMFTLKTAMYTGKQNEGRISSFIHGYELGRDGEYRFIEKLSDSIKLEYNIDVHATGWVGQLGQLAEKQNSDWVIQFKKESLKLLAAEFRKLKSTEYGDFIRKRVFEKTAGIKNWFCRDWISDWFGIVDLSAPWFRDLWSEKELELLHKIEEELNQCSNPALISDKMDASKELLLLCKNLHNL